LLETDVEAIPSQPEKAMTTRQQNQSHPENVPPRDTNDDSGSAGRRAGVGHPAHTDADQPGKGKNAGQGKYGQSGYGQGGYGQDKNGQPPHKGEEAGSSGTSDYGNSNFGSGRGERDESQPKRKDGGADGGAGHQKP
jgi:hypothetical protein